MSNARSARQSCTQARRRRFDVDGTDFAPIVCIGTPFGLATSGSDNRRALVQALQQAFGQMRTLDGSELQRCGFDLFKGGNGHGAFLLRGTGVLMVIGSEHYA